MRFNGLRHTLVLVILFLLTTSSGIAQESRGYKIPDSLKNKGFDELESLARLTIQDTAKSLIYWNSYLQKAKLDNEILRKAYAYGLLSYYNEKDIVKVQYLDSAINVSKNLSHPNFPAMPYSLKGTHYYSKLNYKDALKNFFLSLEAAKRNNSDLYKYAAKRNIGLIKSGLQKYDEALTNFRECLKYQYDHKGNIKDTMNYLFVTLDIAETFTKKKVLDSALFYSKEGIKISSSVSSDPYNFYYYFVYNGGLNEYNQGNYLEALDSISKALPYIKNNDNYKFNAFYYLGRIYEKIDKKDVSRKYYEKIDSIYSTSSKVSFEVRKAYSALVKYYKEKKDVKNQLLYIEKLLRFDSILQNDYNELNDILVKQYDTPQLLEEKERLIQVATTKSSRYGSYIIALIGSVLLFVGLFGYQFYRRRLYQKRFEILTQKKDTNSEIKQEEPVKKKEANAEDIGISESIVQEVLSKLQEFEDKKGFTSTKITLTQLSSELGTNNKYLSKVVNVYKEKSFSQYINDLRIDYIVDRLQDDKKLRNYTIKAIARETGFNTAEVFSKAFYGKHGIYPSYFIKKLEKS